jgi:hypothetical protein
VGQGAEGLSPDRQTQEVATAIENKDFAKAMSLRDPEFEESLKAFEATTALDDAIRLPENQVSSSPPRGMGQSRS